MTPTTSRGQLRHREVGWEGRRRRYGVRWWLDCGGGGGRGRAGRARRSPWSSRGRCVDAAGVRGRVLALSGGERKSGRGGKSVDLGGRRIIKKKKRGTVWGGGAAKSIRVAATAGDAEDRRNK